MRIKAAKLAAISAVLAVCVLVLLSPIFSGCSGNAPPTGKRLAIHYFYMNVCASCNEHDGFMDRFETLTGISANAPNLDIHTHNVYEPYEMSEYERIIRELGADVRERSFPLLLIGDRIVYSSEIDGYLSTGGLTDAIPRPELTVPLGASAVIYFYVPGCGDCGRAEKILNALPESVTANGRPSPVRILRISAADSWGVAMFRKYCEAFSVPSEQQRAPAVFVGYNALINVGMIGETEKILLAGCGIDTPLFGADGAAESGGFAAEPLPGDSASGDSKSGSGSRGMGTQYPGAANTGAFSASGVLGVLLTGLVNGLNPCSISMLLMLLSLLAAKGKWILPAGTAFLLGKFTGFLLLGTILYASLDSLRLTEVRIVINIVLIVFAAAMILLNGNDIAAAAREDYKNIRLQLPRALRSFNHTIIEKAASVKAGPALAAGAAALGLAVSAGEFLCTGQIYLAMILNTVNSGTSQSGAAFVSLALYSAAFIAPPAVLIILIHGGKRLFDMSEFFRKRLVFIKIFNILIFAAVLAASLANL